MRDLMLVLFGTLIFVACCGSITKSYKVQINEKSRCWVVWHNLFGEELYKEPCKEKKLQW